jgi:hypothetical protein
MSDAFISTAHTTARDAHAAAEALRASAYSVWIEDDLLAPRAFTPKIAAQFTATKAAPNLQRRRSRSGRRHRPRRPALRDGDRG